MTLPKHVGPEKALSSSELTALRGLMGSLSWPAVQSSPHLQASTSMLAGDVSKGLASTVFEANKLLKFAKLNSDVGLVFSPLGDMQDWRLVTAFDASFCSRADGTSQGGYFVLLAPKRILETEEDVYHIIDWRSFKLPRVARSSLAAESQAAGCAANATEFACRYFEHLMRPTLKLADLLQVQSVLQPTMVTDAKSVYASYHKESMSSVDRRSGLEIRVVKEQLQSLGGKLRWVSSERQLADGLTKMSTRQSLADRLRHGRVKFLYDPEYAAAKKKSLSERQAEIQSSSKPLPNVENEIPKYPKIPKLSEIPEETAVPDESEVFVDEPMTESNEIHAEECFVQSEATLEYVNAASHGASVNKATVLLKYVFKTLLCWNLCVLPVADSASTEMCFTTGNDHAAADSRAAIARAECGQINHRANVLAVMYDELHCSFVQRSIGYERARRAYVEMRNTAIERDRALQIATHDLGAGFEAIAALQTHFRTCPQGEGVFTQVGSDLWHLHDECEEVYEHGGELRILRPCASCNRQNLQEVEVPVDDRGFRVVSAPAGMDCAAGNAIASLHLAQCVEHVEPDSI
eukprot:s1999_g14.t1